MVRGPQYKFQQSKLSSLARNKLHFLKDPFNRNLSARTFLPSSGAQIITAGTNTRVIIFN